MARLGFPLPSPLLLFSRSFYSTASSRGFYREMGGEMAYAASRGCERHRGGEGKEKGNGKRPLLHSHHRAQMDCSLLPKPPRIPSRRPRPSPPLSSHPPPLLAATLPFLSPTSLLRAPFHSPYPAPSPLPFSAWYPPSFHSPVQGRNNEKIVTN